MSRARPRRTFRLPPGETTIFVLPPEPIPDGTAEVGANIELLVEECYNGVGASCDVLYEVSEVGSDYEACGATCGGRFGWENVGLCGKL